MLWVINCTAIPNAEELREKHMATHGAYLKSRKDIIVLAGATVRDDGTKFLGSVRVIKVNTRAEAEAFSDGDPFVQAGMFSSITMTRMRKGQWNPEVGKDA